jgi:hypothetical protein
MQIRVCVSPTTLVGIVCLLHIASDMSAVHIGPRSDFTSVQLAFQKFCHSFDE